MLILRRKVCSVNCHYKRVEEKSSPICMGPFWALAAVLEVEIMESSCIKGTPTTRAGFRYVNNQRKAEDWDTVQRQPRGVTWEHHDEVPGDLFPEVSGASDQPNASHGLSITVCMMSYYYLFSVTLIFIPASPKKEIGTGSLRSGIA